MSGGIVIVGVLAVIGLARMKLGDATYENIVITIFKWWVILAVVAILGLIAYRQIVG